jgi:large subunit ribosomal protein L19
MSNLLKKVEDKFANKKVPVVKPGQTVEVDTIIRDGDKTRIQKFRGLVIAVKNKGVRKNFTVRKVSYGVGVEKTFPLYSTNIEGIKVIKEEAVRRAKLYFMRDRVGKNAIRVKKGKAVFVDQENVEMYDAAIEDEVDTTIVPEEVVSADTAETTAEETSQTQE